MNALKVWWAGRRATRRALDDIYAAADEKLGPSFLDRGCVR